MLDGRFNCPKMSPRLWLVILLITSVILLVLYLSWDYIPSRLHVAVIRDDASKTEYLISKGHDVNAGYKALPSICPSWTPLKTASYKSNSRIVKSLLEAGAIADNVVEPSKIQVYNSWGAIHLAVQSSCNECLDLLLNYGASVDALGNADVTALYLAVEVKNIQAVKMLLNAGANPNTTSGAPLNGDTPLVRALYNPNMEMIELLLGAGADCGILVRRNRRQKEQPLMDWMLQRTDLPKSVVNEIIDMCQAQREVINSSGAADG